MDSFLFFFTVFLLQVHCWSVIVGSLFFYREIGLCFGFVWLGFCVDWLGFSCRSQELMEIQNPKPVGWWNLGGHKGEILFSTMVLIILCLGGL